MALAWSTGVMAGSMARSLRDVRPMCSASKCVLPWLVPSSEDAWQGNRILFLSA